MIRNLVLFVAVLAFGAIAAHGPAHADDHGLVAPFDWISAWGTINPWDNPSTPETGVPARYHAIKGSIFNVISHCGAPGSSGFDKFEVYTGDLSGTTMYFLDGHNYFPAQTSCVNQILQECVQGQGCYTSVDGPLVASVVTETAPCENAGCQHTQYNSAPMWLDIVSSGQWRLISYNDFLGVREANKDASGGYKYMLSSKNAASPANTGNVLAVQVGRPSVCTVDEMDRDNDGTPDTSCTKYYQYDGGRMVDLYNPRAAQVNVVEDFDTSRFQSNAIPSQNVHISGYDSKTMGNDGHGMLVSTGTDAYSRLVGDDMTGDVYVDDWRGVAHTDAQWQAGRAAERILANGVPRAYEIRNAAADAQVCLEFNNTGTKNVFIPTKTIPEFMSFVMAVVPDRAYGLLDLAPPANQSWDTNGTVPDVSGRACERRYTKWVGFTSCSQVTVACNSSMVITADRRCQRSSGSYGACGECASLTGAADPEGVPAGGTPQEVQTQCFFQTICQGPPCPINTDGSNHHSCINADANVLMADGSYRKLGEIKMGDEVMGFKKDAPRASLFPVRVVKIMATPAPQGVERTLYALNGIPMTAGHSVVLESGKVVPASNVRKGDKLLGLSGEAIKVISRRKTPQADTVYSVWFDNADGFVVEGVRVLGN